MMKKYFTAVPLPLSIAISAILGAVGSGVLILALFAGGLIGLTLFLLGMAAAGYGAHRLLYHVCKKRSGIVKEKRYIPLRAAAVAGIFVYLCGSFFWADSVWALINDFWF